jgi:hypothetical protein
VQVLPLVRGAWSALVLHTVGGVPLVGTSGLASGAATEVFEQNTAGPVDVSTIA